MKIYIISAALIVAGSVQASVVISGDADQIVYPYAVSNDHIRNTYQLENSGDASAVTLSVGETLIWDMKVKVTAWGNTAYNDVIGAGGQGWTTTTGQGLRFGFGDDTNTDGIGISLLLDLWHPKVKMGVDDSVGSAAGFGVRISDDVVVTTTQIRDTTHAIRKVGSQEADMGFEITRNDTSEYEMVFTWGDEAYTNTFTGVTIANLDEFYVRHDNSGADLQVKTSLIDAAVIPEPATLGLVGLVGGIMLGMRRLKN